MFEMPYTDYTTTLNGCNSFILRQLRQCSFGVGQLHRTTFREFGAVFEGLGGSL